MTVTYADTISSSQGGVFIKILILWKGSLYKLVYTDLLFYLAIYYVGNLSYRFLMSPEDRQNFEQLVKFCNEMDKSIPLSFILGFFVAGVIARWWEMYINIPWMNRISFLVYGIITGTDETVEVARQLRTSIMRYLNLGWIFLMHAISEQIAGRFSIEPDDPGEDDGEEAVEDKKTIRTLLENINSCPRVRTHFKKLVTNAEIEALERTEAEYQMRYQKKYMPDYWLPLQWAALLSKKAMVHGFCDPRSMVMLIEEIEDVRSMMQTLIIYNDVMIPLVYTQVVIIAVYSYFLLQLFSQQFVNPELTAKLLSMGKNETVAPVVIGDKSTVDMYFPIFTVFQFLFLMGWLKVAMCVMNPFGDDDEDFHTSEILDYNLEISSRCAESSHTCFPDGLDEPSMEWIRKAPGWEKDNLIEYLRTAEEEYNEAAPPDPMDLLKPFEYRRPVHRQALDMVLCRNSEPRKHHHVQRRRYTERNGKKTDSSVRISLTPAKGSAT